ncbi:putative heterokaryon incompatibility protein [Nemania sp. NC0429]|nr:putative heterokaryon incompatibility protein [Nemania sp. NC0429]
MAPEPSQNQRPSQLSAQLADLPAKTQTLVVFFSIGIKAIVAALRDTVLSKICASGLSRIGLLGYNAPDTLVFIIVHLVLFYFGQSSWRTIAITFRRFASRDGADDDLVGQLTLDVFDLIIYVFMSLFFRNVVGIWHFCVWTFWVLLPVLEFIGLASVMWLIMVDNPAQTFYAEVTRIVQITLPATLKHLQVPYSFAATIVRHCLQFIGKVNRSMVARRDKKTATLVATLEAYQYSALAPQEIRLLKLSKSTPWSPVRCELTAVPLDKVPGFETISYTWGARRVMKPLILNRRRIEVSERVYDIVHDRASSLMTRYIWIDSICINQDDEDEKSSQVRLMRNIFSSSYQTIVWLGYAPDANDAVGFLAHLRRRMTFDDPVERASRPLTELNIENPSWSALTRLINHDYWSRSWVIQEIAVSKKIILSYGGELITWDHFSSLIEVMFNTDPNSVWHISKIYWRETTSEAPPMDAGLQIASLARIRQVISANQSMSLFDVLAASINSVATDLRDNIYSVQGISTAADCRDIGPDYSSTIERPFLKTAEYLLKQDHPSRILHLAGIGFYRNAEIRTSWVPDWSTKRLARIYWRNSTEFPYRASGSPDKELEVTLKPNEFTLTVKGVVVDSIKAIGSPFFGASKNGVPRATRSPDIYNDYTNSRNMIMNGPLRGPYVTGISRTEAFWRTLLGDRSPTGARPAENFLSEYYQSLNRFLDVMREFFGPDFKPLDISLSPEQQARVASVMTKDVIDLGRFVNVSGPTMRERMVVITEKGYIGVAPPYSKVGDAVCIISGTQVPFLLRRPAGNEDVTNPSRGAWQLVGESYFHGMMDGEMMTKGYAEQSIELC